MVEPIQKKISAETAERTAKLEEGKNNSFKFHLLLSEQLLPPLCPRCCAPGLKPLAVPFFDGAPQGIFDSSQKHQAPLEALYCDSCAESLQALSTRIFALKSACVLFSFAGTMGLVLAWGRQLLPLQLLAAGVLPCLALGMIAPLLAKYRSAPRLFEYLATTEARDARTLLSTSRQYSLALQEREIPIDPTVLGKGVKARQRGFSLPFVALVASSNLLWLGMIHYLGTAEVRVLTAGNEDTYLLVNSRVAARVPPTNSEDPRAGHFVHILGGNRKVTLIGESGTLIATQSTEFWPGYTYVVGTLPLGKCLYWEELHYQTAKRNLPTKEARLIPLQGSGPVWKLEHSVDRWFEPLDPRPTGKIARDPHPAQEIFRTSGGLRRAVRLLPCQR